MPGVESPLAPTWLWGHAWPLCPTLFQPHEVPPMDCVVRLVMPDPSVRRLPAHSTAEVRFSWFWISPLFSTA